MSYIIGFISFLIVFFSIVFVHEFGHFAIAKARGILVKQFNIGWGPIIYSKKTKETEYAVRLIPLGGSCVYSGNVFYWPGHEKEEQQIAENPNGTFFKDADVWSRIAVILAGPLFNIILAFILCVIICMFFPMETAKISFIPSEISSTYGLYEGDVIISVNDRKTLMSNEVFYQSTFDKDLDISFIHENEVHTILIPVEEADVLQENITFIERRLQGIENLQYASHMLVFNIRIIFDCIDNAISNGLQQGSFMGPVGLFDTATYVYKESSKTSQMFAFMNLIKLLILISVNFGLMNLIPVPALDGGRLVFCISEIITGKRVPPEQEGVYHVVGLLAFSVLSLFILFDDIDMALTF